MEQKGAEHHGKRGEIFLCLIDATTDLSHDDQQTIVLTLGPVE